MTNKQGRLRQERRGCRGRGKQEPGGFMQVGGGGFLGLRQGLSRLPTTASDGGHGQ